MKGLRVYYSGRVQGVGFRWTTLQIAKEFEVTGTVRNLRDGRVQLDVCGLEVQQFLEAIRGSHLAGHIANEVCEEVEFVEAPRGFRIIE